MGEKSGLGPIRRRDLFKNAGKAGLGIAATIVVGNELGHESKLAKEGTFETALAKYCPIYERHDQHEEQLSPENIPTDLDVLSMEGQTMIRAPKGDTEKIMNVYQLPVPSLFIGKMIYEDAPNKSEPKTFPQPTLDYLKKNRIAVAFGDIYYHKGSTLEYPAIVEQALETREKIGLVFAAFGLTATAEGIVLSQKKIDRRGLLKLGGITGLAAGLGASLPPLFRGKIHQKLMDSILKESPYQRLWARLSTVDGNLLPEFLNGLFRELVQANKLMSLSETLRGSNDQEPFIGYNWHLGHRGIEDWVRMDRRFVRACILAFPDKILRQVIEANNDDPRCLYASRVARVPQSLEVLKSDDPDVLPYTYDEKEAMESYIVEDQVLADKLRGRGIT
ncbi:MAG: hypothetical protein WC686_03775 [Candidatus Shapirobacteria bacterium]